MTNIYIPIPTATSRWKLVGDAAEMQFSDIFLGIVTSMEELYFRGGCAVFRSTEEHQCLTDTFFVTVFFLFLYYAPTCTYTFIWLVVSNFFP